MSFPTIRLDQLEYYLDHKEDMMVIDLRNRPSYEKCHIQGAVNIPFDELEKKMGELPKDRPLVFYCSRGGQSMRACRYLANLGYRAVNVANGITFYKGKYLVRE